MNEFSYKTDVENTSCFIDIAFEKHIHALQLVTTNIGQEFTPGFCSEFAVLSVTFKTIKWCSYFIKRVHGEVFTREGDYLNSYLNKSGLRVLMIVVRLITATPTCASYAHDAPEQVWYGAANPALFRMRATRTPPAHGTREIRRPLCELRSKILTHFLNGRKMQDTKLWVPVCGPDTHSIRTRTDTTGNFGWRGEKILNHHALSILAN